MNPAFTETSAHALISKLLSGELNQVELRETFLEVISHQITAGLLIESSRALREKMIPVSLSSDAMDTCGTGGSGLNTINTSTLTALIVAAAGGKVAKHGNKSASGNCGCFNLLEHLDVRIDLTPQEEQEIFHELGIVFLFAPKHHPALRFIAPLRKQYGKKTIFNLIGPLCNPAGVTHQMIGTGEQHYAPMIAEALVALDSKQSFVVCGNDGLDEVTTTTTTTIYSVNSTGIRSHVFSPADLSLPLAKSSDIEGDSVEKNVTIFLELLQGKGDDAKKNLVLVNSAHALMVANLVSTVQEGFDLAHETLSSGKAFRVFERYKMATSRFS